jgi:glycine oxidase
MSTNAASDMTDCIVIGAGLIGLLTAQRLAADGLKVMVLEKGQPARESSWAGGGILSPLYPWRYSDAVNALACESQRLYPSFCQQLLEATGIDPQWTRSGLLVTDAGEPLAVKQWAARFAAELTWPTAEEAGQIEPQLGIRLETSAWLPAVAQVRNPRLVKSLQAYISRQHVEIRAECPVLEWKIRSGRIVAVVTPQGELSADCYVVASGAWSGGLLEATGIHLPIEPVRGQMILFKGPPGLLSCITLYKDRYAIPRRDGHVLFGSTLEYAGFNKQTTVEAFEDLTRAAFDLLPCLRDLPVEKHWAGLRPGSPEGIPMLGPHPTIDNLYINAGHFRNGVVLGLASANLLSDILLRRRPAIDMSAYLPENFI